MKTRTLPELLGALPFFEGMRPEHLDFISGCAHNVRFPEGAFLLLEGKDADNTLEPGEVVGWSWLVAPYTWHYDARAVAPVSAVAFNAVCVREKCERDPAFGFEMFKRIAQLMTRRLMATRYQLLDVYR
jgi:hypothetical protein